VTVTWTASDPDNDPLTFSVYYSRDDGATWQVIGAGITDTSLVWNTALAGGTTQGRLGFQGGCVNLWVNMRWRPAKLINVASSCWDWAAARVAPTEPMTSNKKPTKITPSWARRKRIHTPPSRSFARNHILIRKVHGSPHCTADSHLLPFDGGGWAASN
jgi:hypothetical protein